MKREESAVPERSNLIPFPQRSGVQASAGQPAPSTHTKRELLTHGQYVAARVLARIIAGGYGGTFRGTYGGVSYSYYLTVAADERARLREPLLSLATRLDIDPEPFIRPFLFKRRGHTDEHPTWPHKVFVACIKLLHQRRREGRPDDVAERLAIGLTAAAERHEAAARSYRPEPEAEPKRDRGAAEARDGDRLARLRLRLDSLKERGEITDSSTIFRLEKEIYDLEYAKADDSEDWPEYIDEEGGDS